MGVAGIFAIVLYVLGMIPTYEVFDKTTKHSKFNKVWFAIFWPAVALMHPVVNISCLFKKKF